MEFGKLSNVDRVCFSLPAEEDRSLKILRQTPRNGNPKIYVGAPVWSCKEWVGKVYPARTPPNDYLKFYSRQYNSIELNSSFYKIPTVETVRVWRNSVPEGFKFSPKVFQFVTHQNDNYELNQRALHDFVHSIIHFEDHLGICLLQLPPYFGIDRLPDLEKLLKTIPPSIKMGVEFRHSSWFRDQTLHPIAFELLRVFKMTAVITDVAGRRDVLHMSLPQPNSMIRFVGNELHPSDYSRIDSWVNRIKSWIDSGLEEVYFFVHHPTFINVPELSNYFTQKLNTACTLHLNEVQYIQPPEPQMSLF